MSQATSGDTVKVHYKGKLEDGREFDSSQGQAPLEIVIGQGQVPPGIENALVGMAAGETKTVDIAADDAFGQHRPELVQQMDRASIPENIDLQVGAVLQATGGQGEQLTLTVVDLSDTTVVLDANHPLAGRDVSFELELVEIV